MSNFDASSLPEVLDKYPFITSASKSDRAKLIDDLCKLFEETMQGVLDARKDDEELLTEIKNLRATIKVLASLLYD